MATDGDQLAAARLKAAAARARLGGTVREIGSRLTPITIAGNALARVRSGNVDWFNMAWRLYRHRGTAMTMLGALAALRARSHRKQAGAANEDEGVSTVSNSEKNGTGQPARGKIRAAAGSAARKAAEARTTASKKANEAYAYSRNTGTKLTNRIAAGVQEHPLSVVIGTIAIGALAAVFLPRIKSAAARTSEALPLDELRDKATQTAREAFQTIGDRLDELGINREHAKEVISKVRDTAIDAASQAASAAQDALQRGRRDN